VWSITFKCLNIAIIYQLFLILIYYHFQVKGIILKVGLLNLYSLPFNSGLIKLCLIEFIYLLLYLTLKILYIYYSKTFSTIKPELCSLSLFLAFSSSMVFLQNDLFSIFLYLEIISFCIYGFLFLQPRTNSQLHGLI